MLKIVEVIPNLNARAGAETFFVNLCCEISKKKEVELFVVCLYTGLDIGFKKQFEDSNIKIYFCNKHQGIDVKANKQFKQLLHDIKPDIIHTHLGCTLTYYLCFGIKKMKWEIFHTCHSIAQNEATKIDKCIMKRMLKNDNLTIVAINDEVKKSLAFVYKQNYNFPVIYNGIPISKHHEVEKEYDFIHIGRFNDVKNHSKLIDAFSFVCKKYPQSKLICLGDGPLLNDIEKKIKESNLRNNIVLEGQVNNVYQYLEKSKIFILPSKYEGNPISVLEAMSCGLPIIATNVGGVSNTVSNNNGILINPNEIKMIVEAMEKLLLDTDYRDKLSKNNLRDIQNYSIETCCENYLKLFLEKETK